MISQNVGMVRWAALHLAFAPRKPYTCAYAVRLYERAGRGMLPLACSAERWVALFHRDQVSVPRGREAPVRTARWRDASWAY
jgi:hypothetical protein